MRIACFAGLSVTASARAAPPVPPSSAGAPEPAITSSATSPSPSPSDLSLVALPTVLTGAPGTLGSSPRVDDPATPPRRRLEWDPRWHRFRAVEYATTAATGLAAIAVFVFAKPSDHPKWIGPILFDTPLRNALRMRTRSGIQAALDASFLVALVTPAQALFDSLVLPAADGNLDLTWQLAMMDAQAYALSGLVTATLYDTTGRARPSYNDCKAGTSVDPLCDAGAYASFPSGHMAAAMTGAGLLCAHHGALPLYGGGAWDVAACIEGLTVATAVGVLRMMADRHYASDVLTGGAIGFFSGYALPMLLHYWKKPLGEVVARDDVKVFIAPGGGAAPIGAQVLGIF